MGFSVLFIGLPFHPLFLLGVHRCHLCLRLDYIQFALNTLGLAKKAINTSIDLIKITPFVGLKGIHKGDLLAKA